jgi:hypothetical protein
MTEEEAAEYIRFSVRSMQVWRKEGAIITGRGKETPPVFYQRGRKIFYNRAELDQWMQSGKAVS